MNGPPSGPDRRDAGRPLPDEAVAAERAFARSFRTLKPGAEVPEFEVRFRPFASLRSSIRFEPESRRVSVRLSDLLADAPSEVLDALATMLLAKLDRAPPPASARRAYDRWLHSPATYRRRLQARKARGRLQARAPRGRCHDLEALFDQLNERYFGGSLRKPALGWSLQPSRKRLGHYDPAHDAIVISRILDRPEMPSLLAEYVLYHEMLHIRHPPRLGRGGRRVHTPEFLASERNFARFDEARRLLRSL